MSTFERGKFQGAKRSVNSASQKEASNIIRNSNRPGFLTLKDGVNIVRHLPPHLPDEPAFRPRVCVWLEVGEEEKGEVKLRRKAIFNSRIHGGTPKDLIEEYSRYAYNKKKDEIQDKEEFKKALYPLNGFYNKTTSQFVYDGIRYNTTYVFYAYLMDTNEIGRIEYYPKEYEDYERLGLSYGGDGVLEVDPFSDPDDGVSLKVTKAKSKKELALNIPMRGQESKFYAEQVVPDEILEKFSKFDSLTKLYVDSFKKSDFEFQLEGLINFEAKYGASHKFNYLDDEEFQQIIEEISNYYEDDSEEEVNHTEEEREVKSEQVIEKQIKAPIETKPLVEDAHVIEETPHVEDTEIRDNQTENTTHYDNLDQLDRNGLLMHIIENNLRVAVSPTANDESIRQDIRKYYLKEGEVSKTPIESKPVEDKPIQTSTRQVRPNSRKSVVKEEVTQVDKKEEDNGTTQPPPDKSTQSAEITAEASQPTRSIASLRERYLKNNG